MITTCLPISIHEEKRLRALRKYPIDFNLTEKEFDEITALAAALCKVPVAYISIVEMDTQYFKSKIGFNMNQSPREISFCKQTIMSNDILEVEDTLRDARFSNNPLVLKHPFVRFYAGVPLIDSSGYKLGSLSVVDYVPRKLKTDQVECLKTLSGIIMNLFELRRSRKELESAKQKADEATQAKADFLSTMSHEIRTPLNGVVGLTNILLNDNPQSHQLETLNALKFSAENLMMIVNEVLDFSKIESGSISFQEIGFNLNELIYSLDKVNRPMAESKGIDFQINISENNCNQLIGDPVRLTQILNNLLGNAIKFTDKGKVTLSVTQRKKDEGIRCDFAITDTGPGISSEDQANLFKRFSQAKQTRGKKGGTGLGLAIAKNLLELQGETINLKSKPGNGSTFSFSLNFKKGEIQNREERTPENELKVKLGPAKILLAEDNAINAMIAKQILSSWGITVEVAVNGKVALSLARNNNYDLILMDIQMPELDGYECTRQLRQLGGIYTQIPILALTASVSVGLKRTAIDAGMNDFLLKPFQPEVLYQKLNQYLSNYKL